MISKLDIYLVALLMHFFTLSASAQMAVLSENETIELSQLEGLIYPNNYQLALDLMLEKQSKNEQEIAYYLGQRAFQWALNQQDETRIQDAILHLSDFHIRKGEYLVADSLYSLAIRLTHQDTQKVKMYLHKLGLKNRTQDWSNADLYLQLARDLIGNDTTSSLMASFYFHEGLYSFESKADLVGALMAYQKAKKIPTSDTGFKNKIDQNIANVYCYLNDFTKAREIGQRVLTYAQEEGNPTNELFAHFMLAFTSAKLEDYDEVKRIVNHSIALSERTGVTTAFGYLYFLMGEAYRVEGQLDSAEHFLQLGIDISEQQGDKKELIDCFIGMMKLKKVQQLYEEAALYGEQVLALNHRPDQAGKEDLAAIYYHLGRTEDAYQMLLLNVEENEARGKKNINAALTAALLEDQFEQETIKKNLAHQQDLMQQQLTFVITALSLIILSGMFIIFLQYRARRKLKQLNFSLEESNKALKQFAYITSHDLKEPIRNIASFSKLLNRKLSQRTHSDDEKEFLGFITSNVKVLKEIVDSLQIFTKISFGNLTREPVILNEVFQTVHNNLSQTIETKNGQLTFHNPHHLEEISFSTSMLTLVLQNLIQNGFKYNEASSPQVEVIVQPEGEQICFLIKDNGIGIEAAYFDRIFSPFKTLKNKSVTQSSGLGLSICKNILERYGGRIHVDSDGINGSTFSFVV